MESAASVEQLHSALANEDYWIARLAEFGRNTKLDSLTVGDDGAVTVVIAQDLGQQALPAGLARFLPGDLRILRTETWKMSGGRRVSGEINVRSPGAVVSAVGDASMEPVRDGSKVRFSATVEVKVPLLGGKIEGTVCEQVAQEIREMHRFTSDWISEHGGRR